VNSTAGLDVDDVEAGGVLGEALQLPPGDDDAQVLVEGVFQRDGEYLGPPGGLDGDDLGVFRRSSRARPETGKPINRLIDSIQRATRSNHYEDNLFYPRRILFSDSANGQSSLRTKC